MTLSSVTLLVVILLALFGHSNSNLIPGPDDQHPYKSAVAHFSLIDTATKDPYAPAEDRKTMLSLFLPIKKGSCTKECQISYMSKETAKICNNQFFGDTNKGIFEKMTYSVCCGSNQAIDASQIPVVVFDPHTDTSRLLYATMARYFSANGVAILLVDHPHDSSIVEFSNSPIAFNSGLTGLSNFSPLTSWNDTVTKAINTRIADIHFALSSLKIQNFLETQFPNLKFTSALNTESYAIIGHGLGGTVATSLSFSDPRVRFSINLSGTPPSLNHSTNTPIYFIGRKDFRRDHDINWPSVWSHLTGPAIEFDLADSAIFDFSDLPVIAELAGVQGKGVGSQGPWGNHAVKCFVEGVIRDELMGDTHGVSRCVGMFGGMVPYMAAFGPGGKGQVTVGGVGTAEAGKPIKSEAVSRRWIGVRRRLGRWGVK
jgi:hypothetical protein